MTWIQLAAGLALLIGAGEALVKGSVGIASRLGVSPLVIGLTLVGFGTSTPELMASIQAAYIGAPGIAIGNVIGSNIANILLILGISALILPVVTTKDAFRRDGSVLVVASIFMVIAVLVGTISRWIGLLFLVLLATYTIYTYFSEREAPAGGPGHTIDLDEIAPRTMTLPVGILLTLGGTAGVIFGANLLVHAAVAVAQDLGLSEAVIGLTLVALGTSLPELVTCVMAAIRNQGDVAFGNIVGSSIFNIFGIAGATALFTPIAVPPEIINLDIWVMMAATLLLVVFAITGWRITRTEGGLFLLAYGGYLAVLFAT
jgi:cation:H+ antiporter